MSGIDGFFKELDLGIRGFILKDYLKIDWILFRIIFFIREIFLNWDIFKLKNRMYLFFNYKD